MAIEPLVEDVVKDEGSDPRENGNGPFLSPVPWDTRVLELRLTPPTMTAREGEEFPRPGIELVNRSANLVEIRYGYWPSIYLTYEIRDDVGSLISERRVAELASVIGKPFLLRIPPGKRWSSTAVSPFVLGDGRSARPGEYHVRGVFRYRTLLARSNVITMTITPRAD